MRFKRILKTDPYREPAGSHEGGRFAKDPNGASEPSDLAKRLTPDMLGELTNTMPHDHMFKKGDKFIALRLTSPENGEHELAGCNAGNIKGIVAHVIHHDEGGTMIDNHREDHRKIFVHEVTCTEDTHPNYKYLGNNGSGNHDNDDTAIGKQGYFFGQGYSFPSNGDGFKSKYLGVLPLNVAQMAQIIYDRGIRSGGADEHAELDKLIKNQLLTKEKITPPEIKQKEEDSWLAKWKTEQEDKERRMAAAEPELKAKIASTPNFNQLHYTERNKIMNDVYSKYGVSI